MLVYKIHPAIGVARVGDSPTAFFIGPEKPGEPGVEIGPGGADTPIGKYKSAGQIKRQGARFRVLEFDRDAATGVLSFEREITANEAEVVWKVDLVNRKAAFDRVIPVTPPDPEVAPEPRNTTVTGADRDGLIIRDKRGAREISGADRPAVPFDQAEFAVPDDSGTIRRKAVFLGELRTDKLGRLIVLGGRGVSESLPAGEPIDNFANNDRWHDDVADGPVTATITFPGQAPRPVDAPAWVTVAPPDFAPEIAGVVTLYDVAFQAAIFAGFLKPAARPSFEFDLMPVIKRAINLRFVNNFSFWNSIPKSFPDLAKDGPATDLRKRLFELLITDLSKPQGPLRNVVFPDFLRTYFNQYLAGDFVGGLGHPVPATTLPQDLDRAALEACVGLNFFPGIEGSQNLRHKAIYSEPFRINHSAPEVFPGFLTEVMAVPWQADFLECEHRWWPSQRPDFLMTDPTNVPGSTAKWAEGFNVHEDMVQRFATLPFVVPTTVGGETVFAKEKP